MKRNSLTNKEKLELKEYWEVFTNSWIFNPLKSRLKTQSDYLIDYEHKGLNITPLVSYTDLCLSNKYKLLIEGYYDK